MRTPLLASAFVLLCVGPVSASEPGQPLDCSDWVSIPTGFTCTELESLRDSNWVGGGEAPVYDNEGNLYTWRYGTSVTTCGGLSKNRFEVVRHNGFREELFGFIEPRCVTESPPTWDVVLGLGSFSYDPIRGRLLLRLTSQPSDGNPYPRRNWVTAIDGFTTLFDVLQTYTPQASLGIRVPYMPEGFAAADHFDTYWGDLTNPIDFTQAKGLQCHYPSTVPKVGDYLAVTDTLPNPMPGQGYYYVTATTYQGKTRYGRKAQGGVLSGRDPSLLPACVEPESRN